MIRPNDFLEIAEESGLIVDIGREMVNVTCRQLADWRREFAQAQGWTISVNVASRDLDKADFVDFIDSVLDAVALPPNRLKLEVTERSLIQNDERAAAVLTELHHRGVKLAIDDFGTGYSSLSYLHRFPFDDLKVDQSFITGIEQDRRRAAQVKAIVQLAHNLELSVTAEGVESAASMEVLKVLRCECVQGHYLSRPIYPEELSRLLESESKP